MNTGEKLKLVQAFHGLTQKELVETRKMTFPDLSENVLYISLIFMLVTCYLPLKLHTFLHCPA